MSLQCHYQAGLCTWMLAWGLHKAEKGKEERLSSEGNWSKQVLQHGQEAVKKKKRSRIEKLGKCLRLLCPWVGLRIQWDAFLSGLFPNRSLCVSCPLTLPGSCLPCYNPLRVLSCFCTLSQHLFSQHYISIQTTEHQGKLQNKTSKPHFRGILSAHTFAPFRAKALQRDVYAQFAFPSLSSYI